MLHPHFTFDNMVVKLQASLSEIEDTRHSNSQIPLVDTLMCAFAMFCLKDESLNAFMGEFKARQANMKNIYKITTRPSDTAIRTIIDPISPDELKPINDMFIKELAEKKVLNSYRYLGKHLLVPIDGTTYFSSSNVHCDCCLETHHKDGKITYQHKCLAAVIVHPDKREVFPLRTEDIIKEDGATKNDCELNAAKRLIPALVNPLAATHDLLITGDALYGNGPFIQLVQEQGHSFLITIKPGSQGSLFNQLQTLRAADATQTKERTKGHILEHYEYANDLFLNGTYPDIKVNMVTYQKIDTRTGQVLKTFNFMTNIPLNAGNVEKVVRAGRARWKIENETFNTLKNQGYNYEHNYGHGHKHLATNFCILMFLAFLINQIEQHCDKFFRTAYAIKGTKKALWKNIRKTFDMVEIPNMETLYKIVSGDIKLKISFYV